jgi:hypothetical protein
MFGRTWVYQVAHDAASHVIRDSRANARVFVGLDALETLSGEHSENLPSSAAMRSNDCSGSSLAGAARPPECAFVSRRNGCRLIGEITGLSLAAWRPGFIASRTSSLAGFPKEGAMANEPRSDMRNVWQEQPLEPTRVSLAELRLKAQRMRTSVLRRNFREYVGAAVSIAAFGYYLWRFQTPLTRAGSVLSIIGALYVMYQITTRGSARSLPTETTLDACLDFHRRELERQPNRNVWSAPPALDPARRCSWLG